MTTNLKIHLLSNQITDLLNQSDLEAGIIVLILQNLAAQGELVLNQQLQKDFEEFKKENIKDIEEEKEKEIEIEI